MSRRDAAVLSCLVLVPACGSSHIEGTKVCRRYPTESVTVDANGNVVHEVVVYGLGPPGDGLDRQIQTTAEICV